MLLALFLAACTHEVTLTGALPILKGESFFDTPFPSDTRMVDGHPDLSSFPNPAGIEILDTYLAVDDEVDGWGTNSPLYVRFSDAIDTTALPSPEKSAEADSPVLLVDVDSTSPHRGEAIPLEFEWTEAEDLYRPGNLLTMAPVFGFPLRPATTYALVLRSPLARPGAMPDVWGQDGDPAYRGLEEILRQRGVDPTDVAAASVFTTQDPRREMARFSRAIHEEIGLGPLETSVELVDDRGFVQVYTGYVTVPIWQHGERPYRSEGGGFEVDVNGVPQIAAWERVKFGLTIPEGKAPDGGWPLVLYSHGTGGNYGSFYSSPTNDDEGPVMAREGVAMFGISQPLHADRGTPETDVELDSFNFLNPEAGRCNFRQGALDQVYLAHLLTRGSLTFKAGEIELPINTGDIAYFGHSQGGLVGAIAAPYFSEELVAAGFSGTGGGLSLTVVLRKEPFDIAALLKNLLQIPETEEMTTKHPVIGVIQMLSEVTDPLNYGSVWFAESPDWPARPLPIELTEGLHDADTPSVATEALAAAARIPIVGDPATDPIAMQLRGLDLYKLPTDLNATDWNGERITSGLQQFPDNGHFAIYENRDARRFYRDFLATALAGDPVLK